MPLTHQHQGRPCGRPTINHSHPVMACTKKLPFRPSCQSLLRFSLRMTDLRCFQATNFSTDRPCRRPNIIKLHPVMACTKEFLSRLLCRPVLRLSLGMANLRRSYATTLSILMPVSSAAIAFLVSWPSIFSASAADAVLIRRYTIYFSSSPRGIPFFPSSTTLSTLPYGNST